MKRHILFVIICVVVLISLVAAAQERREGGAAQPPPTIAAKTAGMEKLAGYFNLYWEARTGKLWLEVDKWSQEFLYVNSLAAGVGSNDIGLDRGQLGAERVVKFERSGPKVLLVHVNYDYRAITDNADERRAVEQAFAQSVLWGFEVAAEEDERALVDATNFFLRDAHDVAGALKRTNQGAFRPDISRSAIYLPMTKAFPQNTEVEATVTLTGDEPGAWLRSVTPTPQAVTVRQHHSFVQLPGPGYKMRAFDPRAGFFGIDYMDYATPVTEPVRKRFIARHRLQKKDPNAAVSEAVEPIVYYLDRGAPEPIRSALLDGARWWRQAFEAAGYKDAFRVEMMPEGADPMDVRYNVIQWVHRSTRGWSYGSTVTDPRTGEIIKGHVSLGSLRVRQDYLIAEGLLAPYEAGKRSSPEALEMALARLRQLSAHEVGHTLGISHNYIASTVGRASVMDYPHPWAVLKPDGSIDLSDAYASGIGEWDKVAVQYGYSDFPQRTDEAAALENILQAGIKRNLVFLTDQDARPPGSAHPATHLWDNGANAVDELRRVLDVRKAALARFSEKNVREGTPLAMLEDALVPIYMLHRYQVEAAVKVVGGLEYRFALRGDGQTPTTPVPAAEQRRALQAVLATVSPEALAMPDALLRLIPPRPTGYPRNREHFRSRSGNLFLDPLSAAEAAAHHSLSLLLNAERAARLVEFSARDRRSPGLNEALDALITTTWRAARRPGLAGEVQRVVEQVSLYHLMALAANERASSQTRAVAWQKLRELRAWAEQSAAAADASQRAHLRYAAARIKRFEDEPKEIPLPRPLEPPDGPPIGTDEAFADEEVQP